MFIDVRGLLGRSVGSTNVVVVDEDFLLETGNSERVEGHLDLTRTDSGVLAKGKFALLANLVCSRCLETFQNNLVLSLHEEFTVPVEANRGRSEGSPGEDVGIYIDEDNKLNLGEVVRQSFILNTSMKPLCKFDCLGICVMCGVNRNLDSCRCGSELSDSRWAKLSELLVKQGK